MPDDTTTTPPPSRTRVLVSRAEDVTGERWDDYADRLREAGAEPIAIDLAGWIEGGAIPEADGLVVTAGVDVDPARYGEARSEYVHEVSPQRDDFETALIEAAIARGIPLLAICRGHQVFNVAHGGSLIQHLEEREPHRARRGEGDAIDSGWHDVTIEAGTRLNEVMGPGPHRVNSRHHQAVPPDGVAPGLVVAAATADGIVEALERPGDSWVVSVQWHPERPEMLPEAAPLFRAFVEACQAGEG